MQFNLEQLLKKNWTKVNDEVQRVVVINTVIPGWKQKRMIVNRQKQRNIEIIDDYYRYCVIKMESAPFCFNKFI